MRRHGPALLLLSLAALGALLAYLAETTDLLPALLVLSALSLAAFPCFRGGIRRVDPRFPLALFLAAFFLKMLGGTARYWALTDIYRSPGMRCVTSPRARRRLQPVRWLLVRTGRTEG
jgi:hypothetical protein